MYIHTAKLINVSLEKFNDRLVATTLHASQSCDTV